MSEENNNPSSNPPPSPPDQPTAPTPDSKSEAVPYERFKEVNEALKKTQSRLDTIEAERKQTEEKQLAEQNKWKELAERREAELNQERNQRLRLTVATTKGLPADLAGRLQGNNEEELNADAERLLQFIKPATGPGVPPPPSGSQPAGTLDITKMTPEEIRQNKTKLLLNGR